MRRVDNLYRCHYFPTACHVWTLFGHQARLQLNSPYTNNSSTPPFGGEVLGSNPSRAATNLRFFVKSENDVTVIASAA